MKLILASCILATHLAAADALLVTNLWLNDQAVMELPVGQHRVTTVNFPHPIQSLDGVGLTSDPQTPGLFQMARSSGNSSLAFRALASGVSANLNVHLDGRTYVFIVTESKNPVLAVNFLGTTATSASSPLGEGDPSSAPNLSSAQLIGIMDKARNYPTLRQQHPSLVADVTVSEPRSITDYSDFTVRLEEVFRFDSSDALVFRTTLQSKSRKDVRYRPGSWAVRIGGRLYPQALAGC